MLLMRMRPRNLLQLPCRPPATLRSVVAMPAQANTHTGPINHSDEHPVIELGNAADLTQGGDDQSIESKQSPYD